MRTIARWVWKLSAAVGGLLLLWLAGGTLIALLGDSSDFQEPFAIFGGYDATNWPKVSWSTWALQVGAMIVVTALVGRVAWAIGGPHYDDVY